MAKRILSIGKVFLSLALAGALAFTAPAFTEAAGSKAAAAAGRGLSADQDLSSRTGGLESMEGHALPAEDGGSAGESAADAGESSAAKGLLSAGSLGTYYASTDAAYWGQYASTYYYEQMSSAEKALWNRAYSACMTLLTGTDDCDYEPQYDYYLTPYVSYAGLPIERAENVLVLFCNANPEFYFLSNGYVYRTDDTIAICVDHEFARGSRRAQYTAAFRQRVEAYLSYVKAETTEYARVKMAHDILAANLSYDLNGDYNQTSAGAMLTSGTVCAGYSEGLELLLEGAGIEAVTVTSTFADASGDLTGHEWVEAKVDGQWYNIDLTWDDQESSTSHTYFLVSDTDLRANDAYAGYPSAHTPDSFYATYNRPVCLSSYDRSQAGNSTVIDDSGNSSSDSGADSGSDSGNTGSDSGTTEPPSDDTPVAVYRLYFPLTGEHLYTTYSDEVQNLTTNYGWNYEDIAWYGTGSDGIPVYRFYNSLVGGHFYTTSEKEKQELLDSPYGWVYEDVAFYAAKSGKPVYRLMYPYTDRNNHLYTMSVAEWSGLVYRGWVSENVAWYSAK